MKRSSEARSIIENTFVKICGSLEVPQLGCVDIPDIPESPESQDFLGSEQLVVLASENHKGESSGKGL
jgi:hypothetical protein